MGDLAIGQLRSQDLVIYVAILRCIWRSCDVANSSTFERSTGWYHTRVTTSLDSARTAGATFDRLVDVMRTLRGPHGCSWDREQTLASLRPFVLEETYELLDALDRGNLDALREELGDVLFEAVFLAQIADEGGHFSIADAIQAIVDKLVRRHPHVFTPDGQPLGEARNNLAPETVKQRWEDLKATERKTSPTPSQSVLAGVPSTLPALLRAYELSARAAAVGFDWQATDDVLGKLDEEVAELKHAVAVERDPERIQDEVGDALFTIVNVARKLGVEPEAALRMAANKFQRRFETLERAVAADGATLRQLTLPTLEEYWQRAKGAPAVSAAPRAVPARNL